MKFFVINGVNLNLTGKREQNTYGTQSLAEICAEISAFVKARGHEVDFFQSNLEGELCTALHGAEGAYDAIILNAGAYSHYSYAIRDAIAAISVPVVEVHLSNVLAREEFRKTAVLAEVCKGEISGFGKNSYLLAIESFLL